VVLTTASVVYCSEFVILGNKMKREKTCYLPLVIPGSLADFGRLEGARPGGVGRE